MVLLWHEPPRQVLPRRISSRPFLTSDDDLSWKVCIILSFKTCALLGMHCPWRPASTRSKPCRKHHRGFWLLWQNRRTWSLHFLICSLILLKRTSVKQEGPRPLHLAFLLQQQFVRWVNNTVFSFYLQKQNRLLAHSSTVFSKSLSVTFVWSLMSPILHLWASSAVSSPTPVPLLFSHSRRKRADFTCCCWWSWWSLTAGQGTVFLVFALYFSLPFLSFLHHYHYSQVGFWEWMFRVYDVGAAYSIATSFNKKYLLFASGFSLRSENKFLMNPSSRSCIHWRLIKCLCNINHVD